MTREAFEIKIRPGCPLFRSSYRDPRGHWTEGVAVSFGGGGQVTYEIVPTWVRKRLVESKPKRKGRRK